MYYAFVCFFVTAASYGFIKLKDYPPLLEDETGDFGGSGEM